MTKLFGQENENSIFHSFLYGGINNTDNPFTTETTLLQKEITCSNLSRQFFGSSIERLQDFSFTVIEEKKT